MVHGPLPCAHLLNMAQESHLFGLIGLKTIQELFIQLPHGLKKLGVLASGQWEPPAPIRNLRTPNPREVPVDPGKSSPPESVGPKILPPDSTAPS